MSGNPRRREVRALTLGFLSLGANAAPLDVLSAAAEAGFGAVGLRVSGRNPGDPWPQPNAEGDGLERIRARAEALSIRISSISGYYMSEKTSLSHLLGHERLNTGRIGISKRLLAQVKGSPRFQCNK